MRFPPPFGPPIHAPSALQALERAYSHHEAAPLHLAAPPAHDAPHAPWCPVHSALGPVATLQVQVGGKPEPPKQRNERHDDFYANVGTAIRTLREDVPVLFVRELNCAPLWPTNTCFALSAYVSNPAGYQPPRLRRHAP